MSTHNILFDGEIRKIPVLSAEKKKCLIWSTFGILLVNFVSYFSLKFKLSVFKDGTVHFRYLGLRGFFFFHLFIQKSYILINHVIFISFHIFKFVQKLFVL